MLESKTFKDFVEDLNSNYSHASRDRLSKEYIKKLSDQITTRFYDSVQQSEGYSLTIAYDHWRGINYRSLLGIAAIQLNGSRYFIELEDVSLVSHSSNEIIEPQALPR